MSNDGDELEIDEEASREDGYEVKSDASTTISVGTPIPFTKDGSLRNLSIQRVRTSTKRPITFADWSEIFMYEKQANTKPIRVPTKMTKRG